MPLLKKNTLSDFHYIFNAPLIFYFFYCALVFREETHEKYFFIECISGLKWSPALS